MGTHNQYEITSPETFCFLPYISTVSHGLLHPLHIWFIYVDDTFTVLQESEVEQFTQHLNSIKDNIKFTVEKNITLAFLVTCICLKDRPVSELGIKPPIRTLCGEGPLAKNRKFDIRGGG